MIAILTNTSTRSQLLQRQLQQRQPLLMTERQRQQRENNKHKLLLSKHPSTQVLPPCRVGPSAFERLRRCAEIKPESTGEPMDLARLGRCVDIKPKSTGRNPSIRPVALAAFGVRVDRAKSINPTSYVLRACHRRVGIARKFAVRREERQLPRYVMRGAVAIASEV